ncbi:MAG: zinc-binding dehydrogenase [Acidimicrobiales bacterium]|jgi:L-iditol 2-dehydrogenase|nr:zinc-binding dehydrogenase [Acidimicrobiales bacterium]
MATMRATRMIDVGQMICEEIAVPAIADGQVLIESEMASICGSDLHVVMMGAGLNHSFPCPHGYPGHEGIGRIVESKVPGLEEGQHVLTFPNPVVGECFNEFQRVGGSYCVPLPECDLPRSHLLMAQQLGTVIYAMRQHPRDVTGETVAVMGQGSAGLFWTYLLKRAGAAQVVVSDLSDTRLAVAAAYGADVCVHAREDDMHSAVGDLTGGNGVDYLVEAVGRSETFRESVDHVRMDGEIMWFGLPSVDADIDMRFYKFFRKRLQAASTYGAQDEPDASSFREALDLIATGAIDVGPLLSHIFPVEKIDEAMHLAHEPHDAQALKVSIEFT